MPARGVRGPVVALSGTPGTGKTSIATLLRAQGVPVLDLGRYAHDPRFDAAADTDRPGTMVLDEGLLDDFLAEALRDELALPEDHDGPVFIDSHFAHAMEIVDRILVLRCRPSVLRVRLAARGWPEAKVRENVEAEALDLIVQEAVAARDDATAAGLDVAVGEIDTTTRDVEETAALVLQLATAESAKLEIGTVDWSGEVLGWY